MRPTLFVTTATLALLFGWKGAAQTYDTNNVVVQTFAGSGFSGYLDGVGQLTMFSSPAKVVADSLGNLFVLDGGNARIRKIAPDGTVSTFAGGGAGNFPGYGTNVSLSSYLSASGTMAIDRSNTLLVARTVDGSGLLRIRSDGYVSITNLVGFGSGICVDSANNIYYSAAALYPPDGNKIYRWRTNGVVEIFAGSGNYGYADGNGIFTAFAGPAALATDPADNIYVWDSGNHLIRKIDQSRNVTTFAGRYGTYNDVDGTSTNASFQTIEDMCFSGAGHLILACATSIRKVSPTGAVVTTAGSFGDSGYANGSGNAARFSGASGVCVSTNTIFVADSFNERIRSISYNPTNQLVLPANLQLNTYPGLRIVGTVGRTYRVESSPNMTNWVTRATLLLNSSPYLWIDPNPTSGTKFYRAWLLP